MACDNNVPPLTPKPCSPGNWYPKRVKLTPEQIIDNMKRLIREEQTFCGQNMRIKSTYVRIVDRMERDLFLMRKIDLGKLKIGARERLIYGHFSRTELSDLYNEIIKYVKVY